MPEIFSEYFTSAVPNAAQKEKFRVAANKLLNQCFILKKKEDTKKDYIFINQNKDIFIQYFDFLGYEIKIDEDLGLISAKNSFGTGRQNFTKIQSILLLILRLLYLEKRNDISNSSENVMVLMQEIRDKYNILKMKTRLDKTTEKDAINLFKRYNLVRAIDADISQSDARLEVYSSVLMAIPAEGINALYEKTKSRLHEYEAEVGADDDAEDDVE